jgi:hypothetical protein
MESFIHIYDSKSLVNFVVTFIASNSSFNPAISESGTLTAFIEMEDIFFDLTKTGLLQLWHRNKEAHAKNCLNTENLKFAYPQYETFINNMTALESGDCIFSIIPSSSSMFVPLDPLNIFSTSFSVHILNIKSLKYNGSEHVKVVSGYNDSYSLFEFSSEIATYWNNTFIYGDLISFIIPRNGTLFVEYESPDEVNSTTTVSKGRAKLEGGGKLHDANQ